MKCVNTIIYYKDYPEAETDALNQHKGKITTTAPKIVSYDNGLCGTTLNKDIYNSIEIPHTSKQALLLDQSKNFNHISKAPLKIPVELPVQTCFSAPPKPGEKLVANIICRKKQKILVVNDALTSFFTATFLTDETVGELENGSLLCCLPSTST